MSEADSKLVEELKTVLGCRWATSYVRYRGRCAYCLCDLLADRQGYATAQIDHLLPQACYPDLEGTPDNWVLSCSLCNHTKRDWDPLEGKGGEDAGVVLADDRRRGELIAAAREYIENRRAMKVDKEWNEVRGIIASNWDKP